MRREFACGYISSDNTQGGEHGNEANNYVAVIHWTIIIVITHFDIIPPAISAILLHEHCMCQLLAVTDIDSR